MVNIVGRKIGMTQIFRDNGELVPATVLDLNQWVVLRKKTPERDGYGAVQVGLLRQRYWDQPFSGEWLKKPTRFWAFRCEIEIHENFENINVGQKIDFAAIMINGELFDAAGITKGYGFQGVVKRHGFKGGGASHGSQRMGRRTGSIGGHRSQGKVDKGKKMPGHMGCDLRSIQNLEILKIELDKGIAFIKGSMPGSAGSLVSLKRSIGNL